MKKIILNFQSPSSLNNAKEIVKAKTHLWTHCEYKGFDNGVLELNIEKWEITCPEKEIRGSISEWMVNEADYTMKLKSEDTEGNFEPLSYPFAVSMLGQIIPSNKLIDYLKTLQRVYNMTAGDDNDNINIKES